VGLGIPRDGALIITQHLLEQVAPDLYERFVRLAEKYQYRDLGRASADAILAWVEAHESSDTMRPPSVHDAGPDTRIPGVPPSDPESSGSGG
jgi:hypothetical protein